MISQINDNKPVKIIYYFNKVNAFKKLIKKYNNLDLLILIRNKKDIYLFTDKNFQIFKDYFIYENKKYKYLTIHCSKGLESKYVIILKLENSLLGIPNKLEDHPIIKFIASDIDNFLYAEERRLFFVALTRCKKEVILLTDFINPSPFVKEIKKFL